MNIFRRETRSARSLGPLRRGAVAQMGERRVRNAEVRSSILLGSTKYFNGLV